MLTYQVLQKSESASIVRLVEILNLFLLVIRAENAKIGNGSDGIDYGNIRICRSTTS